MIGYEHVRAETLPAVQGPRTIPQTELEVYFVSHSENLPRPTLFHSLPTLQTLCVVLLVQSSLVMKMTNVAKCTTALTNLINKRPEFRFHSLFIHITLS
jgi:hypothetical protein